MKSMKYEKIFKTYYYYVILFCPFTSNVSVNVKLHSAKGNVPKLIKFFLQKTRRLKPLIPLSTVFTRINTGASIKFPQTQRLFE